MLHIKKTGTQFEAEGKKHTKDLLIVAGMMQIISTKISYMIVHVLKILAQYFLKNKRTKMAIVSAAIV